MADRKTPNVGYIRPEVANRFQSWQMVDDCVAGEEAIKAAGKTYLPEIYASKDPDENEKINESFLQRAVFFPVTGRTLEELVGEVFIKEMKVDLPSIIELMESDCDGSGISLEQQSKSVLSDVVAHGRAGLLVDFPTVEEGEVVTRADVEQGELRPRILQYGAEQIINWSVAVDKKTGNTWLDMLVLVESAEISEDEFETKHELRWRVYRRKAKKNPETEEFFFDVTVEVWRQSEDSKDQSQIEYEVVEEERPILDYSQQPVSAIPFVFVGSKNNDPEVDPSPLYDIARLNIAHYRNSADVEWGSFNEGQVTNVFTGLTQDWVDQNMQDGVFMGGGQVVLLPQGADAKQLQANPTTMGSELMKHKEDQMKAVGARLIEPERVEKTAFEAGLDKAGEVSVLSKIAGNVSSAYEQAFTFAEEFLSEPSGKSEVTLNTQYDFGGMEPKDFFDGHIKGVISWEEVRNNLRLKGVSLEDDTIAKESLSLSNPDE